MVSRLADMAEGHALRMRRLSTAWQLGGARDLARLALAAANAAAALHAAITEYDDAVDAANRENENG